MRDVKAAAEELAKYKTDDDLLLAVLRSIRPTKRKPMWSRVMDQFAVGSTVAHLICIRFQLNPDATSWVDRLSKVPA